MVSDNSVRRTSNVMDSYMKGPDLKTPKDENQEAKSSKWRLEREIFK